MCTNFTPTKQAPWVKEKFGVDLPTGFPVETYPGFAAPVVVKSHQTGRVACGLARFGLIPAWAKDEKISRHTYNARSETAAEKPSYRTPWRQRQFGLVLVDNFYEPSYESGKAVRWRIELASCGRPSLGTTVEIVDEQGARLPPGRVGEIRAHSDLMMSGYFRNPQATEAVLRDGFIHTGDLGYIDQEGYLHLVDRKRDLIITGGFNVYPSEVEQVLSSHPAVAECAVVGAPDADWGERVTAVVELRIGETATAEDLQAFCRDRLGGVKSPKVVEIWPSLPRSAIGKVLRKDIRMRFWPVGSRQI